MKVNECFVQLSEELKEILQRNRIWVKNWASRKDTLRAAATLFCQLAWVQKTHEYVEKFEEILKLVKAIILKQDTCTRHATPAHYKLEVTLCFLASGDTVFSH